MVGTAPASPATEHLKEGNASFVPVPVLRPREQVEQQLRTAILSGQLPIGAKLPSEAALAVEFSVSRTTVREALRALATQGLINKIPGSGGGSFVRSVDHWSLGQVLQEAIENLLQLGAIEPTETSAVREILEIPAARLAAEHVTDLELHKLGGVLERLAAAPNDDPEIPSLEAEFHTAIALASGNRVLSSLVFALCGQSVRHPSLKPEVGRQHERLIEAIRAKDPQAAEEAMVAHLADLDQDPARG